MVRPRWQKILADLWGNKVRSLLVIASIATGLFAVGMIANGYVILSEDMKASYQSIHPANIRILSESFDEDFIQQVKRVPGVSEAVGGRSLIARVKVGEDEWQTIDLLAVPDMDDMRVNAVALDHGYFPPADRELVVNRDKIEKFNADVGDMIEIQLPNGVTRLIPLVGVVQDQTIGVDSGSYFTASPRGYITFETLEWLEMPDTFNELNIMVSGDTDDLDWIEDVAGDVRAQFERSDLLTYRVTRYRSTDHPNITYMDAMAGVLFLLGMLVVFLSGFLITNTLTALFKQQITHIGIMKSVGARAKQIILMYLMFIFFYGLLALLVAVPASNWASNMLNGYLASQINFNLQGFRIVPSAIFLQVVIALILPQIAGFIPVVNGARISVQKAIHGISISQVEPNRGLVSRLLGGMQHLSRPLLISLRNTFRQRGRLVMTLMTLTLGGAIFIATFNVQESLTDYVDRISRYFMADVNLVFDRPYRVDEVEGIVRTFSDVTNIEGWAMARTELVMEDGSSGDSVSMIAPPPDSPLIEPIMLEGRWLMAGDENAITLNEAFLSRYPDLRVGDTIRMKVDGRETDWVVVGFFQFVGNGQFLAYANYDYLTGLTGDTGRASSFRIVTGGRESVLAEQEALSQELDVDLRNLGFHVSEVESGLSIIESATDGLNIVTVFLLIMASLTALVGSIGLMGTMSMNVMERTREIGVMRAIGASNRIVMRLVIIEGVFIGMIGWVMGALAAFPISQLMADIVSMALFNTPANFTFTWKGFAIWLVAVIILSTLASILPARSAARLTIREVLSYE